MVRERLSVVISDDSVNTILHDSGGRARPALAGRYPWFGTTTTAPFPHGMFSRTWPGRLERQDNHREAERAEEGVAVSGFPGSMLSGRANFVLGKLAFLSEIRYIQVLYEVVALDSLH